MNTHAFLKTPITKEQLKNVIEFSTLDLCYSGWRKPTNEKKWIVQDDVITGGNIGYCFESDEDVMNFINKQCSKKSKPRILYVTYADDNKLRSHSYKTPTKKFVNPEMMF